MKTFYTALIAPLFILLFALLSPARLNATNFTDNGTATTYYLVSGDTLKINSGRYTGAISNFVSGAVIRIGNAATFSPSSIALNGSGGTVLNYGVMDIYSSFPSDDGLLIENFYIAQFNGSVSINGGAQNWNNNFGGLMIFKGSVSVNNEAKILNNGTIRFEGSMTMNGTTLLTNRNTITMNASFSMNSSAQLVNEGTITFKAASSINGTSVLNNRCRAIVEGGLTNYNVIQNGGLLWAKATIPGNSINNYEQIIMTNGSVIKSLNFRNMQSITGNGSLYFIGTTEQTSKGVSGTSGATTDVLRIFDETRTSTRMYDLQSGVIRPSVVYNPTMAKPDTVNPYPGCSSMFQSIIALPVTFKSFDAELVRQQPALTWAADYEEQATFIVERSYNNSDFSSVGTVKAQASGRYTFHDNTVSAGVPAASYRIRAITRSGEVTYSSIRSVRFAHTLSASIRLTPNPVTDRATLVYTAKEESLLHVAVKSISGQRQFSRELKASSGTNQLQLHEMEGLSSGVYVVEVRANNVLVAAQKIIKK